MVLAGRSRTLVMRRWWRWRWWSSPSTVRAPKDDARNSTRASLVAGCFAFAFSFASLALPLSLARSPTHTTCTPCPPCPRALANRDALLLLLPSSSREPQHRHQRALPPYRLLLLRLLTRLLSRRQRQRARMPSSTPLGLTVISTRPSINLSRSVACTSTTPRKRGGALVREGEMKSRSGGSGDTLDALLAYLHS